MADPVSQADAVKSITAGRDGNLWFTDQGTNSIGRISTRGDITLFELPTASACPGGITPGPNGGVWFTETYRIGRITASGVIGESAHTPRHRGAYTDIVGGADGNLWMTVRGALGAIVAHHLP